MVWLILLALTGTGKFSNLQNYFPRKFITIIKINSRVLETNWLLHKNSKKSPESNSVGKSWYNKHIIPQFKYNCQLLLSNTVSCYFRQYLKFASPRFTRYLVLAIVTGNGIKNKNYLVQRFILQLSNIVKNNLKSNLKI